ncbi:TPA: tyrosinase family protein [Bacillus thuringiensis]|uniref:tyrosinase family protein n=1 Tax=Bacillus sp. CH_70 TaxID=2978215 RepID=UPI0030FC15BE|nr:tyrosinase family protein [Bacillus thuringiensis]
MHTRKEIRSITPSELLALRRAMIELQRRDGPGSYIDLAGYHGVSKWNCQHQNDLFLPWHRAYLRIFEQALQEIDSTVAIPFWDWTSRDSFNQGIANAHSDTTFDNNGNNQPNPLLSGPIESRVRQTSRLTSHNLNQLRSINLSVEEAMAKSNYIEFNNLIEGPHGSIHVWVGGDMGAMDFAAYDPIFWSHHATVDRQWAIWQKCNTEQNLSAELLQKVLPGFSDWTVADTLDITSSRLDYTYDGISSIPCLQGDRIATNNIIEHVQGDKRRIVVEVQDIARDKESFMVDIFVQKAPTEEETGVFGGSFGIFGVEDSSINNHEHGHVHSHHHPVKGTQRVDITDAIETLGLQTDQEIRSIELRLLATTKLGDTVDQSALPIGSLNLQIIG